MYDGDAVGGAIYDPELVLPGRTWVEFEVARDVEVVTICGDDDFVEAGTELLDVACVERASPSAPAVGDPARKALVRNIVRINIDVRVLLLAEEVMHRANNPSYFVPLPAC